MMNCREDRGEGGGGRGGGELNQFYRYLSLVQDCKYWNVLFFVGQSFGN